MGGENAPATAAKATAMGAAGAAGTAGANANGGMGASTVFSKEGLDFGRARGRSEYTETKSYFFKFVLGLLGPS